MYLSIFISAALAMSNIVSALPSPVMPSGHIDLTSLSNATENLKNKCAEDDYGLSGWDGVHNSKATRSASCVNDPAEDNNEGGDGLAGSDGVDIGKAARSTYDPNDIIPVEELPPCYQRCIEQYRYAVPYGVSDVLEMTINEWCVTRRRALQAWFEEALYGCIMHNCGPTCFPGCRDESTVWAKNICASVG